MPAGDGEAHKLLVKRVDAQRIVPGLQINTDGLVAGQRQRRQQRQGFKLHPRNIKMNIEGAQIHNVPVAPAFLRLQAGTGHIPSWGCDFDDSPFLEALGKQRGAPVRQLLWRPRWVGVVVRLGLGLER